MRDVAQGGFMDANSFVDFKGMVCVCDEDISNRTTFVPIRLTLNGRH